MRPTKLTPALLDKLDPIAADAWSIREACAAVGISEATWRRWEVSATADELHVRFREIAAVTRAASGAKVEELAWGVLRAVMEDDDARPADRVAAAGTTLRLRTPSRMELTGRDGVPVAAPPAHDLSVLSLDELRTLHTLMAKVERGLEQDAK